MNNILLNTADFYEVEICYVGKVWLWRLSGDSLLDTCVSGQSTVTSLSLSQHVCRSLAFIGDCDGKYFQYQSSC